MEIYRKKTGKRERVRKELETKDHEREELNVVLDIYK